LGLVRISPSLEIGTISWTSLNTSDFAPALAADPAGGLWLGFFNGSIAHLVNGKVQKSFTAPGRVGRGGRNSGWVEAGWRVGAATAGGLSLLNGDRFSTMSSRNGLPCDGVHWGIEDDDRALWLETACGLVRIERAELDGWIRNAASMVKPTVLTAADGVWSGGEHAGETA